MRAINRYIKMAREGYHENFLYFSTISLIILIQIWSTDQALSPNYANVTDSVEPGYLLAKFASKLSALNFRVSRRSNTNTMPDGSRRQCKSQLRDDVASDIGPWSGRRKERATPTRDGGIQPRAPASQPSNTVAVIPSSVYNNSQFRNMIRSHCIHDQEIGFPDCYRQERGSNLLQKVVEDYALFANDWLPNCNITRECAKMAKRGSTETWFLSRWTRISTNRSINLPVCYELDDLRELSPERWDTWWFDFCCYTGAICEPYSPAGWGKLLVSDASSAHRVSQHLGILHNQTCPTEGSRLFGASGLDGCVMDNILAWNVLSGPTGAKIRSDAIATLVRCNPELWINPVRTFESMLNKLTPSEVATVHSIFDAHISSQKGMTSPQVMNSHSSGSSPIMERHEFEMTPRAVSGIVVVIILIFLSILVAAWAVYQKVQVWRHPRNHISYAPIVMSDDFVDGGSQEEMETVGSWSRVEDLGMDSDAESSHWGDGGSGVG